jgi:orotate phosphoribosyltransferase
MKSEQKQVDMSKILGKINAIKFGLFTLSSGKVSPYYVDLRIVPSFPDAFIDICNVYTQIITEKIGINSFDRIAGIPIAGIPFATQVAYNLKKPFLYVLKGVKLHGRERRVEGILTSGDRVLLIDDLVTTGLSLKEAAEAVRAEGGIVTEAVAFIDREEGGKEVLEKVGVKLHRVLKISDVANNLYEIGVLDDENLKTITAQIRTEKVSKKKK